MAARSFLSLADVDAKTLARLAARAVEFSREDAGGRHELRGKTVGLFFRGPSTRTRTSFTVGATRLGAATIAYGPSDLQLATGETLEDTGRVLGSYLDALVVRTNDTPEEMEALARSSGLSVVNAMSSREHPTQAVADLSTLLDHFGRLEDLHVLYVGEGNNTACALAYACVKLRRTRLTLVAPEGYGLPSDGLEQARRLARDTGSRIEQHHDAEALPSAVDVVYATRWQTMGAAKADPGWRDKFLPYRVDAGLMARVSKREGTVFMHDLPAVRGDDVTSEVLDSPRSLVWRQAAFKMWSAMAILEWCVGEA